VFAATVRLVLEEAKPAASDVAAAAGGRSPAHRRR
jgi:hypothetical protein